MWETGRVCILQTQLPLSFLLRISLPPPPRPHPNCCQREKVPPASHSKSREGFSHLPFLSPSFPPRWRGEGGACSPFPRNISKYCMPATGQEGTCRSKSQREDGQGTELRLAANAPLHFLLASKHQVPTKTGFQVNREWRVHFLRGGSSARKK